MPSTQDYLKVTIKTALSAGEAIQRIYQSDFTVDYKADQSPLTHADRQSHAIIVKALNTFAIPILSEEGRSIPYSERKQWQTLWIVDPLDGTKEFVKKNGEFTVNIALIRSGRPILGVIFAPEKQTLFFAAHEYGAFMVQDPAPIARLAALLSADSPLADMLAVCEKLPADRDANRCYTIVGSRSHATPELKAFVRQKQKEVGSVRFLSAGSSLKLCLVAQGAADMYPRLGPTMEWDTAAGHAIVEAAGGRITTYPEAEPLRYNRQDLLNPWFIASRQDCVQPSI